MDWTVLAEHQLYPDTPYHDLTPEQRRETIQLAIRLRDRHKAGTFTIPPGVWTTEDALAA